MQIVTDSAADLTPEEIVRWNIKVLPLMIGFPNEEVPASAITPDEFYTRLKAMQPKLPTTSQPSVGIVLDAYEEALRRGEDVLSIHVSSGLSGVIAAAKAAAQQIPQREGRSPITIVDTMTLSCAQRFQVLAAAMALKAGWTLDRLLARLAEIRSATGAGFTLETLDYLARGGRIGRVQALAGSILKLKPVITVEKTDGKYSTLGKGRTLGQAMNILLDSIIALHGSTEPLWATVIHGQFAAKADEFAALLRSRLNVARLDVLQVSPVLGVHTGPELVGGGAIPMALIQDIMPVSA